MAGLAPLFCTLLVGLTSFRKLDAAVTGTHDVVVDLAPGRQLRGTRVSYSSGDRINKFYGIPYAHPPTGDRRLEPPTDPLPWSGVKDAKVQGNICLQNPSQNSTHPRSEDCLTLSVYSPDLNGSHPVFFWIHGGGFHAGSQYGDGDVSLLARRGLVVVAINYRLGAFGFLSTGDDVMPGNYGMLDQVMALKWVQRNIHVFGGNPGHVTIAGQSAGAISVDHHILSPLSRGLFHRAIMDSGSSFTSSAMERPGKTVQVKDFTLSVASSVGCTGTISSTLLHCLKSVDANRLLLASANAEKAFDTSFIAIPRVETKFGFLPNYPKNLIAAGHFNRVNTLRGYNTGEWSFNVHDADNNGISRQEFTRYFTAFFHKSAFVNDAAITTLVEKAYLGNQTDPIAIRTSAVQALADMNYGAAALYDLTKTLEISGTQNKHFFYQFSYRESKTSTPDWRGVGHGEELQSLFGNPESVSASADDKRIEEAVQTMWANFAKFGDPTPSGSSQNLPHWQSFTSGNQDILQIGLHPRIEKFPRPFVLPLYEKVVELMHARFIVGVDNVVIG